MSIGQASVSLKLIKVINKRTIFYLLDWCQADSTCDNRFFFLLDMKKKPIYLVLSLLIRTFAVCLRCMRDETCSEIYFEDAFGGCAAHYAACRQLVPAACAKVGGE